MWVVVQHDGSCAVRLVDSLLYDRQLAGTLWREVRRTDVLGEALAAARIAKREGKRKKTGGG